MEGTKIGQSVCIHQNPEPLTCVHCQHAHIPTLEILNDIADTEVEIVQMKREAVGFGMIGDRLSLMKRDARLQGVAERERFVAKLRKLVTEREKHGQ